MGSAGLTPKDFKRLPKDGARFEMLVCQLLEAMGYGILEKPAIGTEGGRDVLVERTLKDEMVERREKVVVQCKHYAHSGRAIGDKEVGVWQNAMARYKARGYLLVTDTRVTENLRRSFREFTEDEANYPKWAAFWDVDELISLLNKHRDVRDSFFPPEAMKRTPLEDLAAEVRTWLQAIRYEVDEPQRLDDRSMSMVAVMDEGAVRQRVLVRCIGGEITPADVDALDKVLDRKTPQGWLVSDKRVSDRARERAAEDDAFQVFTLADFLRQMVWGPYFDALTSLVEKDRIPDLYVDLGCYKQEMSEEGHEVGRDRYASLDAYMDDWLTERGKMHMSLLGEFGTGKTWFCRHYAFRQLGRYLKDPANERMPLLITLRAFTKAMTAQQLINDALLEQYKLPLVGSAFQVFQEMNRRGKLLLILDGFDEMARQVDYQTVVDNFWELAELVDEGSKVILTSRTEYFRWAKESEKILGGEEFGRRTIVLSPPKFEVLYLEPFDDDQIREVITRRLGAEDGPAVAERILGTPNPAEMARKPILIELLLAALDEVSADVLGNSAQVYLYATNGLLLRNIDTKRTFTTTADKLYFLCELAWEMIQSGELRIHYTDIPDRIKTYFGDRIKDQHELDMWDYDLRNQTLLHRDAAGYYEFAHKSLAEYFVAFKFAAELGCLAPAFAQTYCEADGQPCRVPIEQKDVAGLTGTFGELPFGSGQMQAVRDFLLEMIMGYGSTEIRQHTVERLWNLLSQTKQKDSSEAGFTGGNCLSLLCWSGEDLRNASLSNLPLCGAMVVNTDLTASDLSNSDLRNVVFVYTILRNTNFSEARLENASFDDSGPVSHVGSLTEDSSHLLVEKEGITSVIQTQSGKSEASFSRNELSHIFYYNDGRGFAAANWRDGSIAIWDLQRKSFVRYSERTDSPAVRLSHNEVLGTLGVIRRNGQIDLFDWETLETEMSWKPFDVGRSLDWSVDGQLLVTQGLDDRGESIKVWDSHSNNLIYTLRITGTRYVEGYQNKYMFLQPLYLQEKMSLEILNLNDGERVSKVTWRRDEFWSAVVEPEPVICFIRGVHGITISNFVSGNVISATELPGGDEIYGAWLYYKNGSLRLLVDCRNSLQMLQVDPKGGHIERMFYIGKHFSGKFRDLDLNPMQGLLIAGGDDGKVHIWDYRTGQLIRDIEIRTDCSGAQIEGTHGLTTKSVEWLKERGAIGAPGSILPEAMEVKVYPPVPTLTF